MENSCETCYHNEDSCTSVRGDEQCDFWARKDTSQPCSTCCHNDEQCSTARGAGDCADWEDRPPDLPGIAFGGAPKNNVEEGKPRMSLIPDDLLREFLTPAYEEGNLKYYRESWRMGFPITVAMDSIKRHLAQFFHEGEDFDKESTERFNVKKHHLGGVLFWALCMCDTIKNHPEMDDRLKHRTETLPGGKIKINKE